MASNGHPHQRLAPGKHDSLSLKAILNNLQHCLSFTEHKPFSINLLNLSASVLRDLENLAEGISV